MFAIVLKRRYTVGVNNFLIAPTIKMAQKKDKNILGLLYLISKSEGGFSQRIRLQKMILLAKCEFGFDFSYTYSSYYYGPYSRDLQSVISDLINDGALEETTEVGFNGTSMYNYYSYKITEKGSKLLTGLSEDLKSPIDKVWEKYSSASTDYVVKSAKEKSHIKSLNER
jgi:uncharacterized protein YwgA